MQQRGPGRVLAQQHHRRRQWQQHLGWTDPLTGKEYVLMGRSNGTVFVDISTPASPIYLGNLPSATVLLLVARTEGLRNLRLYHLRLEW